MGRRQRHAPRNLHTVVTNKAWNKNWVTGETCSGSGEIDVPEKEDVKLKPRSGGAYIPSMCCIPAAYVALPVHMSLRSLARGAFSNVAPLASRLQALRLPFSERLISPLPLQVLRKTQFFPDALCTTVCKFVEHSVAARPIAPPPPLPASAARLRRLRNKSKKLRTECDPSVS